MTKGNSRRTAAFAVANWLATGEFPAAFLPSGPDRGFVQDLVYTTVRRLRPLRTILGVLVPRWPKGELEALLYIGAAQILYMPDVPDFAAVNESVDAAKMCANSSVARVVNGTLRNLLRRRAEFEAQLASAPLEERESYPTELVRRWRARYGEEGATALALWHNRPAETFLARADGSFCALARGRRVEDEPGFAEGAFIVQDPATAHAVRLLDVHPGETILDACAAPGGKTVQLAWRGARVTACEINPKRRARLVKNLQRLQLEVETLEAIPTDRSFDKVLVDAPCSNTGVLRRRPDARWGWSVEKLAKLVKLQAEILDAAASCVAPGGILVYSTCSNEPEENVGQVGSFLARHPEFSALGQEEATPPLSGTDGAFAAAFRRA